MLLSRKEEFPFLSRLPDGSGIHSVEDAETVAWALNRLSQIDPAEAAQKSHNIVTLLQELGEGEEVRDYVRGHLLDPLLELEEHFLKSGVGNSKGGLLLSNPNLFLLKQIAYFSSEPAVTRVIERARAGFQPEAFMWQVIFGPYSEDHPAHKQIFVELSSPLPQGFIGVSLLDAANAARIAGSDFPHPFDSPEGVNRLREYLRENDPENSSYAISATAALPFMNERARNELMELAMDHPSKDVSVEAAWAAARTGSARGVRMLSTFAGEINTAQTAIRYLEELNREDAIPAQARDPNFRAMAEMVTWLAHPGELGEPPASIELYDTRELYWPPTQDFRRVWLFKYRYDKNEDRDEEEVGLGMVGSVTFALFGETTTDLKPWDAYALHCCWELEWNKDSRAPKKRTIATGRKLLKEHNNLSEQ